MLFWCAVALGVAHLLPGPTEGDVGVQPILWQGTGSAALVSAGPNPCTGQLAVLNAIVRTRVRIVGGADGAQIDVDAAFENATTGEGADRLAPIVERYSFARPASVGSEPTHTHRLQVPLVDRFVGSYLAVTLASFIDASGAVSVRPVDVRPVCFAAEDEGG